MSDSTNNSDENLSEGQLMYPKNSLRQRYYKHFLRLNNLIEENYSVSVHEDDDDIERYNVQFKKNLHPENRNPLNVCVEAQVRGEDPMEYPCFTYVTLNKTYDIENPGFVKDRISAADARNVLREYLFVFEKAGFNPEMLSCCDCENQTPFRNAHGDISVNYELSTGSDLDLGFILKHFALYGEKTEEKIEVGGKE